MPVSADRVSQIGKGIRVGAIALAALAASQLLVRPSEVAVAQSMTPKLPGEDNSLVHNSGECIQFGAMRGQGPIEGLMSMSVHRLYTEVDAEGRKVRDITEHLKNSNEIYDDIINGSKVDTVQGLEATFSDWKVSVVNGSQSEVVRGRFAQNQEDTQAYWLRQSAGTWENVGEVMKFTSAKVDGSIEVKNNCGVKVEVDGFDIRKDRILRGGKLREVLNAVQRIGRDCHFRDVMVQEHFLRPQQQPEDQILTPLRPPEETRPAPAQVPGQRPIPAPVQTPK